ncbi:MAG: hypothetical protein F7B61_05275 [Caldisphaeraceae archaeon]|nr:hypothetical protein [Caldisphaeraceae archaeon]
MAVSLVLLVSQAMSNTSTVATNASLTNMFMSSIHNPYELITIVIEIIMGLVLGYVSVKALKYILAFILIVVIGIVLNVWSFGGGLSGIIANIQKEAIMLEPVIRNMLSTLGILTMGPILFGYVIGIIIGVTKK